MPRSFSCWNDKRRPGAKLFNDFSGIAAASNPDEGGWSWSRSEQGLTTEGLDVDELVASLTDDREVMEQFGVAQPPLSPPAAPSARPSGWLSLQSRRRRVPFGRAQPRR